MRGLEQLNAPTPIAPTPAAAKEIAAGARELYERRFAAQCDLLRSLDAFTNDEIRGLARLCRDFTDTMRASSSLGVLPSSPRPGADTRAARRPRKR